MTEIPPNPARAIATPADLFARLDQLGIATTTFDHPPAFTVDDLMQHADRMPGMHIKNLFLCDAKKKMWLVTLPHDRALDLKKLPAGIGSARLSFGSADRLMRVLGIKPGSVSPFAAINDPDQQVKVVFDSTMMSSDIINAHPLVNTQTTAIRPADLIRFLESCGHRPQILDLSQYAPAG
ncbi:MAG: prolyl-tRNA synthetase associated domain-containing protein [Rhodobacteraceae bacterium]|nr:prolyl-tRNA synthetase associated domain-containing protein [Paracoccaceae bacterium]